MKAALVYLSVFYIGAFAAPNDIPDVRLVGGGDAKRGQFPYQASIQYCLSGRCSHACGGAIIDSLWVLSAAHCITQAPALGSYQVITGILNLDDDNPEREVTRVSYALIHPDYDDRTAAPHDLAIFKLANPLTFSNLVQPISLPEQDAPYGDDDDDAIFSGWGSISGSDDPIMPLTLQYAHTPILFIGLCLAYLDSILGYDRNPLDLAGNVCTGPVTGGVSICAGDSGGPLVDSQGQTLIGIASWIVRPCGRPGAPSVHVSVSRYSNWIKSSISK